MMAESDKSVQGRYDCWPLSGRNHGCLVPTAAYLNSQAADLVLERELSQPRDRHLKVADDPPQVGLQGPLLLLRPGKQQLLPAVVAQAQPVQALQHHLLLQQ
jgi:hypothetical protein